MSKSKLPRHGLAWSQAIKLEFAAKYAVTGNWRQAAKDLGVPFETAKSWRYNAPWFQAAVKDYKQNMSEVEEAETDELIRQAKREMADRLKEGNYVYDRKTGKMVRQPVSLRELGQAHKDLSKLRMETEDRNKGRHKTETMEEKLAAIMNALMAGQAGNAKSAQKEIDALNPPLVIENGNS